MALTTPVITLGNRVRETQKDLYSITFIMICTDSDQTMPGLNESYSIKYRPGDNPGAKVVEVTAYFQEKIDSYKSAVAIEKHPALATALIAIKKGLAI